MQMTITTDPIVAETEFALFKSSAIHGTGGFAAKDIPAGARIAEYVGEKINKQESLRRCESNNEYIFDLDEEHDLDGSVEWNPARFINHGCTPNCEAEVGEGRVWIVALRAIQAGEELTYNYGFDLSEYMDYPCRCGSPDCVGFIVAEEYFDHLRQQPSLAIEAQEEIK